MSTRMRRLGERVGEKGRGVVVGGRRRGRGGGGQQQGRGRV